MSQGTKRKGREGYLLGRKRPMSNELKAMCESVRNTLDTILNDPESWLEDEGYDMDEYALGMWFANSALEVEVVSSLYSRNYRGSRIYVTLGGPTIWIDTTAHTVNGTWGTERESVPMYSDVCNMIDDYVMEIAGTY